MENRIPKSDDDDENQAEATRPFWAPLDHFLDLAIAGKRPAALPSERQAARLAAAIVNDLPGLDERTREGLEMFIETVAEMPAACRDLFQTRS